VKQNAVTKTIQYSTIMKVQTSNNRIASSYPHHSSATGAIQLSTRRYIPKCKI